MQNKVRKQHYIPRTYLYGFKSTIRIGKHDTIFQYNKDNHQMPDKPYSIEDVAKLNYFYEMFDVNNKIVNINFIERCLSQYEANFTKFKWQMIQEFKHQTYCSPTEREYWLDYMALQLLRTPTAFEITKAMLSSSELSQRELKNMSLYLHFPFLHENKNDFTLFSKVKNIFKQMHFFIIYAPHNEDFLITSDNPICLKENKNSGKINNNNPFEFVYFPVCSKFGLCLYLENSIMVKFSRYNGPSILRHDQLYFFNSLVYHEANKYVFSDRCLSNSYIYQLENYFQKLS